MCARDLPLHSNSSWVHRSWETTPGRWEMYVGWGHAELSRLPPWRAGRFPYSWGSAEPYMAVTVSWVLVQGRAGATSYLLLVRGGGSPRGFGALLHVGLIPSRTIRALGSGCRCPGSDLGFLCFPLCRRIVMTMVRTAADLFLLTRS